MPTLVRSSLLQRPPTAARLRTVKARLHEAWRRAAIASLTLAMGSIIVVFGAAIVFSPRTDLVATHVAAQGAPPVGAF